ncbi:MAG: efflux RND transporter periplasmic adaptor subunit [Desulfobacteraceae bacterium]|nr:efflux RND transporter periplasmic adaptor subunit [Desulfobacteraceae bacterium]
MKWKTFLRPNVRRLLVLCLIAAAVAVFFWWRSQPEPARYVTSAVTRGSIVKSIVTTGTVNPVVTVQVGTYVSGVIKAIYCDYNTQVKAGQLCAKIDPRPYQLIVDQDVANLASARAQREKDRANLTYNRTNYERDLKLLKEGVVSQDTVDSDKSATEQAEAQVKLDDAAIEQHQAALNAARVNLGYTDIVSPVSGVVVSRNVDVGQTVAATFQTPTLFLIAKDLTKMQVDTNVSESDVGGVRVGQQAYFSVEAYPDKFFWGHVTQVRQAPITVQNVVTYDVVVGVENPSLELLPGMTANTRIITAERRNVLRVPLQAIRFSPGGLHQPPSSGTGTSPPAAKRVWVLRDGRPQAIRVTTGLSDNTSIEITGGPLKAGDPVVVNEIAAQASSKAPPKPPFRL